MKSGKVKPNTPLATVRQLAGDLLINRNTVARACGDALNIRVADLESYGRVLLLDDVTADGKHVLMWNE